VWIPWACVPRLLTACCVLLHACSSNCVHGAAGVLTRLHITVGMLGHLVPLMASTIRLMLHLIKTLAACRSVGLFMQHVGAFGSHQVMHNSIPVLRKHQAPGSLLLVDRCGWGCCTLPVTVPVTVTVYNDAERGEVAPASTCAEQATQCRCRPQQRVSGARCMYLVACCCWLGLGLSV
jgi:hypothetical protein